MVRSLLFFVLVLGSSVVVFGQGDIRKVDFANFTYMPYCAGEDPEEVRVSNGEFSRERESEGYTDRFYFQVYDFIYGDIDGDHIEEAIISSVCNTGGTGNFTEGFIFKLKGGKPVLLDRIPGGDRAYGGLREISIRDGIISVEANDVGEAGGACCPQFSVTSTYRIVSGKLTKFGKIVRRELYPKARVNFAKGASSSTIKANIEGFGRKRFVVGARAGQVLKVSVNSKDVSVFLFSGEADVSDLLDGFSAVLKENGDFVIEAENSKAESLEFSISVSIK